MTARKRKTKPKTKPITTIEMEVAIANFFGYRQNIIVPNISWGLLSHEVDLLIVRKSGVAIEVEIKTSLSDLKADFTKKHKHIERLNRISYFYYAMPYSVYEKGKDLIPQNAGIIVCDRIILYNGKEDIRVRMIKDSVKIKGSRSLTSDEQFKVARLGAMRIFSLKKKIIGLKNL